MRMNESILLHPIKVVALKTGLSPHLIRVWERRYGAVTPGRTSSQRRMYSDEEIKRLKLLQALTEGGHSIGNIATLPIEELRSLLANGENVGGSAFVDGQRAARRISGRQFVSRCVEAISKLDQPALETALQQGAVALGQQGVLVHVIAPLAEEVGNLWMDGTIGVAHEHFASAILRTFLGNMSRPYAPSESAPHFVAATPTGQLHELGAMLITAAAVSLGWQATYLGASISAPEIASAVKQRPVRAVGVSIVYPLDDPGVTAELKQLKNLLPKEVVLLVGGRAAAGYQSVIDEIGAISCGGPLTNFMGELRELEKVGTDRTPVAR